MLTLASEHTPCPLTAHSGISILTANTVFIQKTLASYSLQWPLTAHWPNTANAINTLASYSTHWPLTRHTDLSQQTFALNSLPWPLTANTGLSQNTHWYLTEHHSHLQHTWANNWKHQPLTENWPQATENNSLSQNTPLLAYDCKLGSYFIHWPLTADKDIFPYTQPPPCPLPSSPQVF